MPAAARRFRLLPHVSPPVTRRHGRGIATPLLAWETYASARNSTSLPADPAHFANFLAESAEGSRGYAQTKQWAGAIDAISRLALLPSPAGDETVSGVRAGIRRTRCCGAPGPGPPDFQLRGPGC